MKNYLLFVVAAASILLGGCSTSSLLNSEAQESSLKGVSDAKYYLQLRPVEDVRAYKFEICLTDSQGRGDDIAGDCVGAIKTNTGDDLLLPIQTISKLSLTESEKTTLLKNHEEYLAYQQSLQSRGHDVAKAAGISAGIIFGGSAVTLATKQIADEMAQRAVGLADSAREGKEEYIRKAAEKAGASDYIQGHLGELKGLLVKVKGEQNALQVLQQEKVVESGRLQSLLDELTEFRGGGVINGKEIDVQTQLASESMASGIKKLQAAGLSIYEFPKGLVTAQELGNRTTLISDKFLKFVAEEVGDKYGDALTDEFLLGLQPEKFSRDLYEKWISYGGKITEIFESEFYLTKIFEYNKIENALSDTAESAGGGVRLGPENIDELAYAFESGDFRFFKDSQEFVDSAGRSPKAVALYDHLMDVDTVMAFHYEESMEGLIKEAKNNIASFDDRMKTITKSIDLNLDKILGHVSTVRGTIRASIGGKKFQEATNLVERADKLAKETKWGQKILPPVMIVATVAAMLGVGYVFAKDHVTAYANVQDVLDQHDELSTLVSYGSALLSVDDTINESVSSVETVLLNFAKWLTLVSSYSSESNIVVEKICLPKASSFEDVSPEAECQTIDL